MKKQIFSFGLIPLVLLISFFSVLPSHANYGEKTTDFVLLTCPTAPSNIAAFAIQVSCTNGSPNNDGYLQISEVTDADRYHYSLGNTFDNDSGAKTYTNADALGPFPETTSHDLPNPLGSQDYTIRIYNGADDCFTDVVITLQEQDCTVGCSCTEMIYLNEPTSGGVHKFAVAPNGSFSEVLNGSGDIWYAGNQLPEPHGLGVDLNGFLYIGEMAGGGDIRRLTCDGEIFPEGNGPGQFNYPSGGQFNIGSLGNTIYFNNVSTPSNDFDIRALDICTQSITGTVEFCEPDAGYDWGFFVDRRTGKMYASHSAAKNSTENGYLWIFDESDFDNDLNTCVSAVTLGTPLPVSDTTRVRGITTDLDENIYIAIDGGTTNSNYVLKYGPGPNYPLLAQSPFDNTEVDQEGYTRIIGIVYSEIADKIYASTQSAVEDCVSAFDTDLNYLGPAVPSPGTGGNGKGISILKECCPTNNNITIDTILCVPSINTEFFLQELINCEGTICEGSWEVGAGNTGLTYNECDQTITVNSLGACGTFTLGSNGTGNNPQCGAFTFSVNIEVKEISSNTISGNQTVCSETVPNTLLSNASSSTGTLLYQWQSSTTNCDSGFSNIVGATSDTYSPDAITETTYFRLITSINGNCASGDCSDISNCVAITLDQCCPPMKCGRVNINRD